MATGEADGGNSGATWRNLLAEQLRLRAAISEEDDPAQKAVFVERFHANRETIRLHETEIVSGNGRRHQDLECGTPGSTLSTHTAGAVR